VTCRPIYRLNKTTTTTATTACAAALDGVMRPEVGKEMQDGCICICRSLRSVLGCLGPGVVHGVGAQMVGALCWAHAGMDAEGWAKHGPPGSPETHDGGARTRAYRRTADKG
jgi:hypothetical protein